jgi:hypothetical protein
LRLMNKPLPMKTLLFRQAVAALAFIFILFSCDSEEEPLPAEFINGYFGDEFLQYTTVYSSTDTFLNAYYYSETDNQINLIRRNPRFTRGIDLFLRGEPLDDIKLPYRYPHANLQLLDLSTLTFNACQFCPMDSINYSNRNYPLKVILTGKKDDVLTGTFEGTIETVTGKLKTVENGKFRIKVIRTPF